jgi:putative leucine rich repeat protein
MNTDPQERIASIKFLPVNEADELEKEVTLTVKQEAAPEITDDRRGDSIAIVIASTKLRSMTNWDASERLDYWLGVTVWEKTDKGVTPEQLGRVRSVEFRMLNTKEELPAEIGKIKYLETLVVYGNTNTMLLPSPYRIGNALAGLKYLRNLTISALGITTISKTELESSRKDLITLDLSGNNFTTIPYDLTPANFPGLLNLSLTGNRRYSTITDLSTETRDNPGLCIDASSSTLKKLLKWKNLKSLSLSYNLIYGKLPTFINSYNGSSEYGVSTYTDEDIQQNDTLMSASEEVKAKLKTIPNILPNAEHFSINLNFLTGDDLPDWLLYHPRFARFDPFTLIYTQDSGKDKSGNIPGFKNEPSNLEWFYERYPKARPTLTDN